VLGAPQQSVAILGVAHRGDVDHALHARIVRRDLDGAEALLPRRQGGAHGGAGLGPTGQAQGNLHSRPRHVELPVEAGDVLAWDVLQPDAAPDPGGAVVPDAVRLLAPVLLAARQLGIVRVIEGAHHHDVVRPVVQQVGEVAGEGGLPAHVMAGQAAVHPDVRFVVHGAEVQQHPLAGLGGGGELAAVPDHGMEAGLVDARGLGFGHEGHGDGAVEGGVRARLVPALGESAVGVVMGEGPGAVEALPVLAHEGGAGVGAVVAGGAQGHLSQLRWCGSGGGQAAAPAFSTWECRPPACHALGPNGSTSANAHPPGISPTDRPEGYTPAATSCHARGNRPA